MAGWINSHFLLLILILSTVLSWLWLMDFEQRLSIRGRTALLLAIGHTLLGVACVKAFAFLEGVPGGMSLYGAVFFLPLVYFLGARWSKRPAAEVFDVFTICTVLTLLLARVNCLHNGCCLGAFISGSSGMRWPTREAEIVFYIALIVWLGGKILKNKAHGTAYPIYMFSYGIFRFICEFFRENESIGGQFHLSHVWSICAIAVGLAAYFRVKQKTKKGKSRRKHND